MKSYKQFIGEAGEVKAFLAGDLPITKRKKKKVGQKVVSKKKSNDLSARGNASDVSVPSASSQEVDNSNLIHVGGNYMGRPDYSESVDVVVDVMNRLYPVPEWKLLELCVDTTCGCDITTKTGTQRDPINYTIFAQSG